MILIETGQSVRLSIPYRSPLAAFAPFKDEPLSLLLHGGGQAPAARWSYVMVRPEEICVGAGRARTEAFIRRHTCQRPRAKTAPFEGGVAGVFCYEYSALLDPAMPQVSAEALPDSALGYYPSVAAFDHMTKRAFVFAKTMLAAEQLAAALGENIAPSAAGGWVAAFDSSADYCRQVAGLIEAIRAGDLFQANISRRFVGELGASDHPFDLFARLCVASPAPFGAYLRLEGAAIVSNSPERLADLRISARGWRASSSPIKGTRPRGANEEEDRALAQALLDSEKERAENVMIVDLMRNDVSRVSRAGSVRAPRLFEIESFANVHHLVSTVEGLLKPECDAVDLFNVVFPAGSITGAPKIKAMEVIRAAEQAPRHACYGSLVWFGEDGEMDANVLIRTALCAERRGGWDVNFRVGGGITVCSDPNEEALETEAKAQALLGAIGCVRA